MILSLKELLNVSSDWLDVKNNNKANVHGSVSQSTATNSGGHGTGNQVPTDF